MAKPKKITGLKPNGSFHENAHIILPQKVQEVYSWEQFIRDPTHREELHNMRLAVKRLRYTMEFFVINYDKQFHDFLETIIDLQDILGDIHDNDVVLDTLTVYKENHETSALSGIETLIARICKNRNEDYQTFLKKWEQLSEDNFKQKLLKIIAS